MVTQFKSKILLFSATLLLTPILLFFGLELWARWSESPQLLNFKTDAVPPKCDSAAKSSYRLSVDLNHLTTTQYTSEEIVFKKLEKNYNYFYINKAGYPVLKENETFRQRATVTESGKIVYDVTYRLGEGGRRNVPGAEKILPQEHLAVAGCSMVFGEGLNDEQTLAAHMQKTFLNTKTYNLGRPGGSVVDAISMLQTTNFWKGIEPKKGTLLLFHASQIHVPRFLGTISTVGVWNDFGAFLVEDPATELMRYGGVYYKNKPFWTLFSVVAAKSQFF